MTIGQARSRL